LDFQGVINTPSYWIEPNYPSIDVIQHLAS